MDKADFIKRVKLAEDTRASILGKREEKISFNPEKTLSKLAEGQSVLEIFKRNFSANHGTILESEEALADFLKRKNCSTGIIDKQISETFGLENSFDLSREFNRQNGYDACHFGISKADFAIAESGHLVLKDSSTNDRMVSIAPWIHIAVLDPQQIVLSLSQGLAKTVDCPYAIYVGGPSKTTDVEGILVEGVHGPGIQACLLRA